MNAQTASRKKVFVYTEDILHKLRRLVVVGDIHGDLDTLKSSLEQADPSRDGMIFLGDYADKGYHGVEVIDTIDSLLKEYPENVVALKGNHEDYIAGTPNFRPCSLIEEVMRKGGNWGDYFRVKLKPFIDRLYLAAIIPGEVLFVHGGISSEIGSLDDLENPEFEEDILWSDPFDGRGEYENRRGAGVEFGEDVTEEVCRNLGIKRIIRGHQPRKASDGPFYQHGGKVITIGTTSVDGGRPFIYILNSRSPSDYSYQFL